MEQGTKPSATIAAILVVALACASCAFLTDLFEQEQSPRSRDSVQRDPPRPRTQAKRQPQMAKPRPQVETQRLQSSSTVSPTIQDFQRGIPLFEQQGFARQEEPGGIEYLWAS